MRYIEFLYYIGLTWGYCEELRYIYGVHGIRSFVMWLSINFMFQMCCFSGWILLLVSSIVLR